MTRVLPDRPNRCDRLVANHGPPSGESTRRLSKTRAVLGTHYDPAAATSELNRLAATLAVISAKVTALLDIPAA